MKISKYYAMIVLVCFLIPHEGWTGKDRAKGKEPAKSPPVREKHCKIVTRDSDGKICRTEFKIRIEPPTGNCYQNKADRRVPARITKELTRILGYWNAHEFSDFFGRSGTITEGHLVRIDKQGEFASSSRGARVQNIQAQINKGDGYKLSDIKGSDKTSIAVVLITEEFESLDSSKHGEFVKLVGNSILESADHACEKMTFRDLINFPACQEDPENQAQLGGTCEG